MKYDYLVVGSGLYGAIFAHEAKKYGKTLKYCRKYLYRKYDIGVRPFEPRTLQSQEHGVRRIRSSSWNV